jgi:Uma2 family endonuclease
MVAQTTQIQKEVRDIVFLLMKRPITEEIAMQVEAIEGFEHLEIDNGEWVGFDEDEIMSGEEHGRIEFKLILRLGNYVEQNDLGVLYPGDTVFVLDGTPDDMRVKRRPDIAFVRKENAKRTKGYIFGAPDIAIEIISPTERPGEIRKKLHQYLDHGVKQVWQVYPDAQEIVVHFPDRTAKTYRAGDTLIVGDVLPGFTLEVTAVFTD